MHCCSLPNLALSIFLYSDTGILLKISFFFFSHGLAPGSTFRKSGRWDWFYLSVGASRVGRLGRTDFVFGAFWFGGPRGFGGILCLDSFGRWLQMEIRTGPKKQEKIVFLSGGRRGLGGRGRCGCGWNPKKAKKNNVFLFFLLFFLVFNAFFDFLGGQPPSPPRPRRPPAAAAACRRCPF